MPNDKIDSPACGGNNNASQLAKDNPHNNDIDHDDSSSSFSSKSPGSSEQSSSSGIPSSLSENSSPSSSSAGSSFGSSTATGRRAMRANMNKEKSFAKCMGVTLVALWLAAGSLVAKLTYDFALRTQDAAFQQEFAHYAGILARRSYTRLSEIELKMSTHATATTLNALEKGEEWPFVTFKTFEQSGGNLLRLTDAEAYATAMFVSKDQREQWELYSQENQGWVQGGLNARRVDEEAKPIAGYIHRGENQERDPGPGPYAPVWQIAPAPVDPDRVNFNLLSNDLLSGSLDFLVRERLPVVTPVVDLRLQQGLDGEGQPGSCFLYPITGTLKHDSDLVASTLNCFTWDTIFKNILHQIAPKGILLVLSNACDQEFTYVVNQENATYFGEGDHHDASFADMVVSQSMQIDNGKDAEGHCPFQIDLYPTEEFRAEFDGNEPNIYVAGVAVTFFISITCSLLYGACVVKSQIDRLESTLRINAIVSSLFPKNVLNRLLNDDSNARGGKPSGIMSAAIQVHEDNGLLNGPNIPIADLFPSATVIFSDLVGFTAWSSAREPAQVFTLLETVYYNFDVIARKRRVFKVETIGDCYVAVCGLPDARKHHATVMAKFANDCIDKLNEVVHSLEIELGPDTAELSMRFGLHSGPVTAGVLRGEKSRFQLFGETVDMAAKMEHTGTRNRIHASQATADLIVASGKAKWVESRQDKVLDEKKGDLQTSWVNVSIESSVQSRLSSYQSSTEFSSTGSSTTDPLEYIISDFAQGQESTMYHFQGINQLNAKTTRLVDWMTELLGRSLKKIVAMRAVPKKNLSDSGVFNNLHMGEGTVLDEVKEIIPLPGKATPYKRDPEAVVLDDKVQSQLKDYVKRIASMYREVPFHGFEHASHVTMSVSKLLSRIVDTQGIDYKTMIYKEDESFQVLHKMTYGITSDPLTQFALGFSALIHDVDHTGVPNATLVEEKSELAELYNNQSVAEQNSVDLAWDLFLTPQYKELQRCICQTQEEFQRFRQLVVNTVMATDIVDKELGALRKLRWKVAFDAWTKDANPLDTVNRKATIVIEHLMQASDVAHTMQHWHVYQKWNERFFQECYLAYKNGRAEKDPSIGWYKGELGFFDFYVIPLAKKLKECGVFGVASDEYLTYAQKNRDEWQRKGEYLVAEYLTRYEAKYGVEYEVSNDSGLDLDDYEVSMKG